LEGKNELYWVIGKNGLEGKEGKGQKTEEKRP